MPRITLRLDDPALFAEQLEHAATHWDDGRATPIGQALHMAAYQIKEQLRLGAVARFCSLRQNCRMSDGHAGECRP